MEHFSGVLRTRTLFEEGKKMPGPLQHPSKKLHSQKHPMSRRVRLEGRE